VTITNVVVANTRITHPFAKSARDPVTDENNEPFPHSHAFRFSACYALWYGFSYRTLHANGDDTSFYQSHPEYMPPSTLGLLGARWWDFLVLFLTVIVLAYVIRELWIRRKRMN
jgi:hypothetical protein